MKFISENDLDFLSNHHRIIKNELQRIADSLEDLPYMGPKKVKKVGKRLSVINYSDMGGIWTTNGKSYTLDVLKNRLQHMILTGKADSVEPMLRAIANNKIKKLKAPSSWVNTKWESLGYGHFRSYGVACTLTKEEINRVKEYFNL